MAGPGSSRRARSRVNPAIDASQDETFRNTKSNSKLRKSGNKDQNFIRIFNVNLKILLGFSVFAFLIIVFLIYHLTKPVDEARIPRVITPFPAPKVMDLPQFQGEHKESLYWGTYRPNVYLGIRARTPRSLIAGLMWIGVKDGRYAMRHVCQDSDELSTFGWTHHNGRDYGHQVLVDQNLNLATSFLKSKEPGSGYGGDWVVRLNVQSKTSNEEMQESAHIFFYLADEDGNTLSLIRETLENRKISLLASGSRLDIGDWQLHLKSMDNLEVHYSGFRTPHIHNLSDLVQQTLGENARKYNRLQLPDTSSDSPNIVVFQISARIPFKTDIAFISGTGMKSSRVEERLHSLTGNSLTNQLEERQSAFDAKFKNCFDLTDKFDSNSIIVGKAAIANMLGGIGYFYGQSKISVPKDSNLGTRDKFLSYWPAELYTAVPSRSFFPRGFLWDEGFHQLLIWRWDIKICLDILGHWLDLMNIDGWIPREQILGAEARSKVPEEFVLQHPTNGNPPTLFLVLRDLIFGMKRNKFTAAESNDISSFLDRTFVRLEAWFQWFNTTQAGKDMGSYFWHGRDSTVIREHERHLDLRCWMLLAAECLDSITDIFHYENKPLKDYGATVQLLSDFEILNQMHFDDKTGAYFDFGNHTEKVRLSWKEMMSGNHYTGQELVREVLGVPQLRLIPHIGYVSLFPFMMKIIPPDSWILEKQLNLISNQSILWTNYGLRSLSRTSSLYMKYNTEHDPPYWRGPIWMNINYMTLSALNHYSKEVGPYKDKATVIYKDLRNNLIRNVVRNYNRTGFLWEQYDQKKGKGKGARPFTGWTSLVLLMMAEVYSEK